MTVNSPIPGTPSEPDAGQRAQRIGVLLRRTREGRRIAIGDVAATLRIRVTYLEAIETGAYEKLPGPVYAVGFVRAYAEYLGLDGEEAARRFKREGQGLDHQPDLTLPMPIAERSIPGGRILMTALVLAICGYGLWYYVGTAQRGQPDGVAAVPPALRSEGATPNEAKAAVKEPSGLPIDAPNPGSAPAPTAAIPAAGPAPQKIAAVVAAPPPPEPVHIYGVADGPARIVLRFTGDCWIQIKGGGPDADLGKLMHAGDVYRVPDKPGLVARVGNSDAVAITVDGRIVTLPKANSLVRNVALDPNQLVAWAGPPAPTPAAAQAPAIAPKPMPVVAAPLPPPVDAAPADLPKAPPPDLPEND
jgi:cytoskeleton protein RodZ